MRKQVRVEGRSETLSDKVAHMAEADKENIAEVGGDKDVIRRLRHFQEIDFFSGSENRCVSVLLVRTMTELGMDGAEHLLRGWGNNGYRETVGIIELRIMKNGVFGRRGHRGG
jgi:hypothetical protein